MAPNATDVFERSQYSESFESSALGAVVIGMKSLGLIDDLSAVGDMIGVTNTHEPNEANFTGVSSVIANLDSFDTQIG